MPTGTRRFVFARLNVLIGTDAKMSFLRDALASKTLIERRRNRWGVFNSREVEVPGLGTTFLAGSLVKYRPLKTEETVDEAAHELTTAEVEDVVEDKSAFYLHVASGVMAYEDASPGITPKMFRLRTAEVINEAMGKFFANAQIQAIDEELAFLEAVKRLKRIVRYTISLHPSNPSNRDVWAAVDARIKRLGVGQYREEYTVLNSETGQPILDDDDVRAKTLMAEDGYGKATVVGEGDHGMRTVTTQDNPVGATVPASETDDRTILEKLWDGFTAIFRRLKE